MEIYKISFGQWIKSKYGKIYLIVSTVLTIVFSVISYLKMLWVDIPPSPASLTPDETFIKLLPYIIQILFILFVVLISAYKYYEFESVNSSLPNEKNIWDNLRVHRHGEIPPKPGKGKEERWIKFKADCNKSANQFVWFWVLCWISWLAFYFTLTFFEAGKSFQPGLLNFANNVNALFFIFLFTTLSTSTADMKWLGWSRYGLLIILIFIAELSLNTSENKGIHFIFSLFSGLLNGLAMASFVGSINSRSVSIPIWVLLLLTLYPAIQPLYFLFSSNEVVAGEYKELISYTKTVIMAIAFFLKVLLFLLVTWILQTGRLMHFMVQEGSLNYDKKNQFNIFVNNARLRLRKLI